MKITYKEFPKELETLKWIIARKNIIINLKFRPETTESRVVVDNIEYHF